MYDNLLTDLDYEPDNRVSQEAKNCVHNFLDYNKSLIEHLGFADGIQIHFVKLPRKSHHLARYCNGTSSQPVIVVDAKVITKTAKKYGVLIQDGFDTTLWHELGHAWLESVGAEVEPDQEEELVEEFADHIWRNGDYMSALEILAAGAGVETGE